jgi:putative transposase
MMTETDPETPHRHSIRLKGWDYAGEGWYFVTLVAFRRECLFGVIQKGEMTVNALGRIVQECWEAIPAHFPNVTLDEFVIMPNHVHGIIVIENNGVGAIHEAPLRDPRERRRMLLPKIIGYFKMNTARPPACPSGSAINTVRAYIRHNPLNWSLDHDSPQAQR